MKYDFSKVLINQQRKPMTLTDDPDSGPWTAALALAAGVLAETSENAKSKLSRFNLWQKLGDHVSPGTAAGVAVPTDYSVEEVALLREAALTFPAIFAGQLVNILDQK